MWTGRSETTKPVSTTILEERIYSGSQKVKKYVLTL